MFDRSRWMAMVLGPCLLLCGACGGGGVEPTQQVDPPEPLRVISTYPLPDAREVPVDAAFEATFDRALDPSTVDETTCVVADASGPLAGALSYDARAHRITFAPELNLAYGTTCTVTLTSDIEDAEGLALEGDYELSFTAQAIPEALDLSARTSASLSDQVLAFNDAGDGLALWTVQTGRLAHVVYAAYDSDSGTWSDAQPIAPDAPDSRKPDVATDGQGFLVVWEGIEDHDAPKWRIYGAFYESGAWSDPVRVSAPTGAGGEEARVAWSGFAYMVVFAHNSGGVRARAWSPEHGWWDEVALADFGHGYLNHEAIDVTGNAQGFCVVWGSSRQEVVYACVSRGLIWGPVQEVPGSTGLQPRVAADGTTYCVVHRASTADGYGVYASHYLPQFGTWSGFVRLSGPDRAWVGGLVFDGQGFTAVWMQYVAAPKEAYVSTYRDGSWASPYRILSVGEGYTDEYPLVASNGNGYAVSWLWGEDDVWSAVAYVFDAGAVYSAQLLDASADDVEQVRIGASPTGYVCTWMQPSADGSERFHAASFEDGWGASAGIGAARHDGECESPCAAVDASGRRLVVWAQYDRGRWHVYGRLRAGPTWGPAFRVAPDADRPVVASSGHDFLVAWHMRPPGTFIGNAVGARRWKDGVLLAPVILTTEQPLLPVRVASNGTGYAVAWAQDQVKSAGTFRGAVARVFDGSAWSDLVALETLDANVRVSLDVVSNGDGYAVTWTQEHTDDWLPLSAWCALYGDAGWMPATRLVVLESREAGHATAANRTGYGCAWAGYACVHDGSEWRAPAAFPSEGSDPAVAADDRDYVAAWKIVEADPFQLPRQIAVAAFDADGMGSSTVVALAEEWIGDPLVAVEAPGWVVLWTEPTLTSTVLRGRQHRRDRWQPPFTIREGRREDLQPFVLEGDDGCELFWVQSPEGAPLVRHLRALRLP